ncbi:MAG: T9SS type A sorting domain-containing protein [Bacteroidales bacterium]|nr:T9SS type A sorting domain-containing protein [Bacteroidales bacterium]
MKNIYKLLLFFALLVTSMTGRAQIVLSGSGGDVHTITSDTTVIDNISNAISGITFNVTVPGPITITWNATITGNAALSDAPLVLINGANSTLVVGNGLIRSEAVNSDAVRTNGNVEVNGGEVSTGFGGNSRAIRAIGTDSEITINGGEVTTGLGGGSSAIQATGINSRITVNNGEVSTGSGGDGIAIEAIGINSHVTINNGEVRTNSVGGIAISTGTTGTNSVIEVKGGTITSVETGSRAIQTVGDVIVSGGLVMGRQYSIRATGTNKTVSVIGGEVSTWQYTPTSNTAIRAGATVRVIVDNIGRVEVQRSGSNGIIAEDTVFVHGGNVTVTSGTAIRTSGVVIVTGGIVEATEDFGNAIDVTGANSTVTVSGGRVSVESNAIAIHASGTGTIRVSGGTVEGRGSPLGHGIIARGDIYVSNGTVSASAGRAISTENNVFISGGSVHAGGDATVTTTGTNSVVTVSGGTVSALGIGIDAPGTSSTVNISGGVVTATSDIGIRTNGDVNVNHINSRVAVSESGGRGIVANGSNKTVTVSSGVVEAIFPPPPPPVFFPPPPCFAIVAAGQNNTVNVTGGRVSALYGTAISSTGSNNIVNVSDGEVRGATNGSAIDCTGLNNTVNVSGGVVSGSSGSVGPGNAITISSAGSNNTVTVSGGEVRSTGGSAISSTAICQIMVTAGIVSATVHAIFANGATSSNSSITVEGGEVSSSGNHAIRTFGSSITIDIQNTAIVRTTNNNSSAIHAEGVDNVVTVSNGTVTSTTGTVIVANGGGTVNPAVTVSGGLVRTTLAVTPNLSGAGIDAGTREVVVTGTGVVFAFRPNIGNLSTANNTNVIIADNFIDATGTGIVIAWNPINWVYCFRSSINLTTSPEANTSTPVFAVWDSLDNRVGIDYQHGSNTGFLDVNDRRLVWLDPAASNFPVASTFSLLYDTLTYNCDWQAAIIVPRDSVNAGWEWRRLYNIYYNGSTDLPINAGRYGIKIDVLVVPRNSTYCPANSVKLLDTLTIVPRQLTVIPDTIVMLLGSSPTHAYLNPLPPDTVRYRFYDDLGNPYTMCASDADLLRAILEVFINSNGPHPDSLPLGLYPGRVEVDTIDWHSVLNNYVFNFETGVLRVRSVTDIDFVFVEIGTTTYRANRDTNNNFILSLVDVDCNMDSATIEIIPSFPQNVKVSIILSQGEEHPEYINPRGVNLEWHDNEFFIRIISIEDTNSYSDFILKIERSPRVHEPLFRINTTYEPCASTTFNELEIPGQPGNFFSVFYNDDPNFRPINAGTYRMFTYTSPDCLLELGTLIIHPRELTVTARDLIVPCNAILPDTIAGWFDIIGFVCGDDKSVLTELPIVQIISGSVNTSVSGAGAHPGTIIVSGGKADSLGNYVFAHYIPGTVYVVCSTVLVTVLTNPADGSGGTTIGGGVHSFGADVTVTAFANRADCRFYRFVNWTTANGDSVLSTENSFTLVNVREDVVIVANFERYDLDFDTYAATLWDNTFKLNKVRLREDGFDVIGCRWYRNDQLLPVRTVDEFTYSAGPNRSDLLELNARYRFVIRTTVCDSLSSTVKILTSRSTPPNVWPSSIAKITAYPNPISSGDSLTLVGTTKGSTIQVYNRLGLLMQTVVATDLTTTFSLNLPAGLYSIHVDNQTIQILVN